MLGVHFCVPAYSQGGGYRAPVASTGWRLTAENLSVDTSWQDLKDFARTGGKVEFFLFTVPL